MLGMNLVFAVEIFFHQKRFRHHKHMSNIHWLGAQDDFPNPIHCKDPDPSVPGLIAVSDRIYPGQLARAYQMGIFPWYSDNQPVLWWSPNPRMVLKPVDFKCHDSLKKTIRHFLLDPQKEILVDQDFGGSVAVLGFAGSEHRHKSLAERALGKHATKQIGNTKSHVKRVGQGAGAKERGHQGFAQQSSDARGQCPQGHG